MSLRTYMPDDQVFVLGTGVNRFIPQWDEQVLGPENTFRIKKNYNATPKPDQLPAMAFVNCSECQLTWLVGRLGGAAASHHPTHSTLQHVYAGTRRSIIVHTDGACPGNGTSSAKAGVGVYFGPNSRYNISEAFEDSTAPTSQRAELYSLFRAMQLVRTRIVPSRSFIVRHSTDTKHFRLILITDSSYAVECMCKHWQSWTEDARGTLRNKQGKKIANSDLLLALQAEVERLSEVGVQVVYYRVAREFNRAADALAKAGAEGSVPVVE